MKILKKIWNWCYNAIIGEDIYSDEYLYNKSLSEHKSSEDFEEYNREYEDWLKLEELKQLAIQQCEGCKDEVFVLKKSGVDIAYGSNINRIAVATKLPAKSLYRAYNKQQGKYKEDYLITKLI